MKYEININDKNEVAINYNGKCYGVWNNEANIDCPEDLTFGRDLNDILEIGIDIGRQMERDSEVNKLKQADVIKSVCDHDYEPIGCYDQNGKFKCQKCNDVI